VNACEMAEKLCVEAEKLGLCHPTESMIAEMLGNIEANHATEMDIQRDILTERLKKAREILQRCAKENQKSFSPSKVIEAFNAALAAIEGD
jgi:hypothetical protein